MRTLLATSSFSLESTPASLPPWAPQRDALSWKTFGCLARPTHEWVWGDALLIDQPGCYGEAFTSFAGPSRGVQALVHTAVEWTTHHAQALCQLSPDRKLDHYNIFAIGHWEGAFEWDAVVLMGLCSQRLLAMNDLRAHHPELFQPLVSLTGDERLMEGSSDTFWNLVERGIEHPDIQDPCFDLASRLSPALSVSKSVEEFAANGPQSAQLAAWIQAHQLEGATAHAEQEKVRRRI